MTPRITTYSGRMFDLLNPEPDAIDIETVAHALSNLCRYTGHCSRFYSVAEHSVMVSRLLPVPLAMHGLLHDATEAYVGDMAAPLKALCPDYQAIESRVEAAVAERFGLDWFAEGVDVSDYVTEADRVALVTEARVLLRDINPVDWGWLAGYRPCSIPVVGYSPDEARRRFLDRYHQIKAQA